MSLTNPAIRSVDKCLVLDEGSVPGPAKLNATERGDGHSGIEEILGIKNLVSIEHECCAVEVVDAALGNGVDNRARRMPVLRSVIAGKYGKLLDAVHSQIQPGRATGGSIRIVVDAYAVNTITVLIGAVTGIAQLVSKAAVTFVRAKSCSRLVRDTRDSRLEGTPRAPIAALDRQCQTPRGIH